MEPMDFDSQSDDLSNYEETDELFLAVLEDDLEKLKFLVSAGGSVNRNNALDETLLQTAIRCGSVEIFKYLMSFDDLEIDRRGKLGKSALLYSAGVDEYFSLELIRKGANVNLRGDDGDTFLHLCDDELAEAVRQAIEKGADVNAQNKEGVTPLYRACENGDVEVIYMLLYYEALATIPSYEGILPIIVLYSNIPEEQRLQLEEILFDHTFDVTTAVPLRTLIEAMCFESPLFSKIVTTITDVRYDICDLELLADPDWLLRLNQEHFKVFLSKFSSIVSELLRYFSPFIEVLDEMVESGATGALSDVLFTFFESDHVSSFIEPAESDLFHITKLIYSRGDGYIRIPYQPYDRDESLFEIMYILYSYGFDVYECDLKALFECYGVCEIFKILLHMDIQCDTCHTGSIGYFSMALLYFQPDVDISLFCSNVIVTPMLLNYYNYAELKEVWSHVSMDEYYEYNTNQSDKEKLFDHIKSLPRIPSLVELSRNASRKLIWNRCHRKNSMHFYTNLKSLPIGEINKQIIALEKPLY